MVEWHMFFCPKHGLVGNNKDYCDMCDDKQERHYEMVQKATRALDVQEGGDHYKTKKIQPVEYIMANGIGFMEGNVIKYVSRWKDKNGVEDLKKARHYLDLLIEAQQ